MQQKLKLAFRQKQLYKELDLLQPIVVECDIDGNPTYIPGTVPKPNFEDFTDFTEGLDKLQLNWEATSSDTSSSFSNTSETNDEGSNFSKGVSLDLRFYGAAFDYIYEWMMTDPCQILNSIEVQITDVDCNKNFRLFELKVDNLRYAPFDEPCIVSTVLRERDLVIQAFQTTIIEDDWQGWFNSDGTSTKDHPTFIYVVEKKPQFMLVILVALAYIAGILSTGILTTLTVGKEWIRKLLGVAYFCPSPYIYTYIQNICSKFGYTYNTIFDEGVGQYEQACLFFPVQQYLKNHTTFDSPQTKFLWDNRTGMSFAMFLDQLKLLFNCEWYVTPNKELVFQPKSYFDNLTPIYDFTAAGSLKLYNFFYQFNGNKKPSYGDYEYKIDPQDTCSNDLKWRYDTIVDFDRLAYNPMMEGNITKNFAFGCTSFMYDGATEDFMRNAIEDGRTIAELAILVGLIALLLATNPLTAVATAALLTVGYVLTNDFINDFFHKDELEGAIRTSSNVINVPRILYKNPESLVDRANVFSVESPTPNTYYNPTSIDYYTKHPAFNASAGYFGTDVTKIYNYPLYIDEDFEGNLYDLHEHDNPLKNPIINQEWEGDLDACCSTLNLFGVWENDYIKIGAVVILENRNGRLIKGRIESIDLNEDTGMIHLKGRVLK